MKKQNNGFDKPVTKAVLDKSLQGLLEGIRAEITFNVENAVERIETKITKFKDEILTTVDPLLQELETRSQEREIGAHQISEIRKQADDHEKRIILLEKPK